MFVGSGGRRLIDAGEVVLVHQVGHLLSPLPAHPGVHEAIDDTEPGTCEGHGDPAGQVLLEDEEVPADQRRVQRLDEAGLCTDLDLVHQTRRAVKMAHAALRSVPAV